MMAEQHFDGLHTETGVPPTDITDIELGRFDSAAGALRLETENLSQRMLHNCVVKES